MTRVFMAVYFSFYKLLTEVDRCFQLPVCDIIYMRVICQAMSISQLLSFHLSVNYTAVHSFFSVRIPLCAAGKHIMSAIKVSVCFHAT